MYRVDTYIVYYTHQDSDVYQDCMEITLEKFKEMLVPAGHVTEEQFAHATGEAQRKGISFSEELIEEGLISDTDLGKTIADFFDHHFVDLHGVEIQDKFLTYFPEAVARAQRAIIFAVSDDTLSLATEYIDNYEFFRLLEKKTGKHIMVQYATMRGIENAGLIDMLEENGVIGPAFGSTPREVLKKKDSE